MDEMVDINLFFSEKKSVSGCASCNVFCMYGKASFNPSLDNSTQYTHNSSLNDCFTFPWKAEEFSIAQCTLGCSKKC